MNFRRISAAFVVAGLVCAGFAGCTGDDDGNLPTPPSNVFPEASTDGASDAHASSDGAGGDAHAVSDAQTGDQESEPSDAGGLSDAGDAGPDSGAGKEAGLDAGDAGLADAGDGASE
jgi:hypothetical protein